MCYNTRQDIPQSFMIFGVPKVFILYFTKWPKIPCMSVLSTRRSTAQSTGRSTVRSTDVCVWGLTENPKLSVRNPTGDRSTARSTDVLSLCTGIRWYTSVDRTVDRPGTHRSTVRSTDVTVGANLAANGRIFVRGLYKLFRACFPSSF